MAHTIYLVRHGEKEKHMGDPALTSRGLEQAKATGTYFKDKIIDHMFTSPYLRTRQTAQAIAQAIGKSAIPEERLKERLNWGERKNETFAQFWEEWQKTDLNRDYIPVNGRSSHEVGRGVTSFLEDILHSPDQAVILVTHGGTIGDFLRTVFPEHELPITSNAETGAQYIEVDECSITIVEQNTDGYAIRAVNSTDHLSSPAV